MFCTTISAKEMNFGNLYQLMVTCRKVIISHKISNGSATPTKNQKKVRVAHPPDTSDPVRMCEHSVQRYWGHRALLQSIIGVSECWDGIKKWCMCKVGYIELVVHHRLGLLYKCQHQSCDLIFTSKPRPQLFALFHMSSCLLWCGSSTSLLFIMENYYTQV